MSTNAQNFDWGATKFKTNQIPGDVVGNENLQKNYKNLAEDFWQMADTINRIVGDGNDGFEGKWTSAFGDKAKDLATDLTNFGSSADVVSNALIYWQPLLQDHINDAKTHIDNYKNAKKAADNYYSQTVQPAWTDSQLKSQTVQSVNNQLDSTQAQIQSAQSAANNAQSHAEYVQHVYDGMAQSVQDEEDALQKVINDYNDDAKEVASRINHATDDYIPSSFWDFTYTSTWRTVAGWVKKASVVVGFVALFVGGGPITLLAFGLTLTSFLMNDVVQYAHGNESLGKVLLEGVSVAASFVDAAGAFRLMKAGQASFWTKFHAERAAGTSYFKSVGNGLKRTEVWNGVMGKAEDLNKGWKAAWDIREGSALKVRQVFAKNKEFKEKMRYIFEGDGIAGFLNKISKGKSSPDGILLGLNKEFKLGYLEAGKDLSLYRIGIDITIKGTNACVSTVKTLLAAFQTVSSPDSSFPHKFLSVGSVAFSRCEDAMKIEKALHGDSEW